MTSPQDQDTDGDDFGAVDPQEAAGLLLDGFADHDTHGLAALDDAGRTAQLEARRVLFDYVDALWEDAKRRGVNPATRADWSGVAGMRDLLMALQTTAWEAADDTTG